MTCCVCGELCYFIELVDEWIGHDPKDCEAKWEKESQSSGL